ncbi:acetyltransferase [Aquiflexum sp. LQ15W]|uniref:acetyltransferase n=1 Tax=Cognataquiflexum nitidum TaxID=2922272 RepID=UPI001F1350E2|nr:acetyltransferase [Cognataquiflexum nitidum]MCH6199260.1 acetyltransferase [Cognataquiflexum nitidum]
MTQQNKIFIIGYSGHAYVVLDSILEQGLHVGGYFAKDYNVEDPYNLEFFGDERADDVSHVLDGNLIFPCIGDNAIRAKVVSFIKSKNFNQLSVLDKTALVSSKATIGLSTFVGKNAVINSLAKIGEGVIINTGAVIEHECIIGDFSHVAPNATLAGNVSLGSKVFFGVGAVAKQGISIGDNSIVGAGSVVISDIPANEVWVGNPARKIKTNFFQ